PCSSRCACCFFFQAEDGIRDRNVTGVQTCALPILAPRSVENMSDPQPQLTHVRGDGSAHMVDVTAKSETTRTATAEGFLRTREEIGRASCRERVEMWGGAGSVETRTSERAGAGMMR